MGHGPTGPPILYDALLPVLLTDLGVHRSMQGPAA